MAGRWLAVLVRAYPPRWRVRYGAELDRLVADLRGQGRHSAPLAADLLRGAAVAWLIGSAGSADGHVRRPLTIVLWSWVAFAATAAWFGKNAGEYPSAGAAEGVARAHPAVVPAYDVLLGAGIAGLVATALAAVVFGVAAVRFAIAHGRPRILVLVAVPPVVAAVWLGVLSLLGRAGSGTAVVVALVGWLLAGLAGIAFATWAVTGAIAAAEFPPAVWHVGRAAAAAITCVMTAATAATVAWGLASYVIGVSRPPGAEFSGWLLVVAILGASTVRAAMAMPAVLRPAR